MGKKKTPAEQREVDEIVAWLLDALAAMRLPPHEVLFKWGKIEKSGEPYVAEIEVDEDYLQLKVTIDRTIWRRKSAEQQKTYLTHELGHAVAFGFDRAIDDFIKALKELIPPASLKQSHIEKAEELMGSEGEKLIDHLAFLALPRMPKWKGV